ncbi:MAG: serine hydrolase [Patescibacteria group bacterium]
MFKKILFTTLALFLSFGLVNAETTNLDRMVETQRTIERIQEDSAEGSLELTTLHPKTKEEKALLTGRIKDLSGSPKAYFEWGTTREMEEQTDPKTIDEEGRFVEELDGLRGSSGAYHTRLVVETEEGKFYGNTVSFGVDEKETKREDAPEINAKATYSSHYQGLSQDVNFRENGYKQLPIGGLTKLMTALVAYENFELSDQITIPEARLATDERLSDLVPFRETTVEDLLKLLLVDSSNGAAYALSVGHPDTNFEEFISMMNEKASELGMNDTTFYNPIGLDGFEGVNLSTARDMAYLTEEIIGNDFFEEAMGMESFQLESKSSDVSYGEDANHNKFISGEYYFMDGEPDWYEGVLGGHSGWTSESGASLITLLRDENKRGYHINVLLGVEDEDMSYMETDKLIDWVTLGEDEELEKSQEVPKNQEPVEKEATSDEIEDSFTFEENLSLGMSGQSVKNLQILLNKQGMEVAKPGSPGSPGMETDYFGPATKQALVKFQEKHFEEILKPQGLFKGTGVVGEFTREKLNQFLPGEKDEEKEEAFDYEKWMKNFEKLNES